MSSKFLGVVIVLILLLGYSCELQSITASPVGSISGKVTIVDYPIPVTGALVSISGRDNSTRVVDDNGQFFFLWFKKWRIFNHCAYIGFLPASFSYES